MSLTELYTAIDRALAQGVPPLAVARELGVHRKTVYKRLTGDGGAVQSGREAYPLWRCDHCGLIVRQTPRSAEPEPIECPCCRGSLWPPVSWAVFEARLEALSTRLVAEFREEQTGAAAS